jgi:hypothetical protein
MATGTRRKPPRPSNEIIDGWFARQDASSAMADEARGRWEAGMDRILDYTETIRGEAVVTHCERYFAGDDSGQFVVVCFDDHGNTTFGGM